MDLKVATEIQVQLGKTTQLHSHQYSKEDALPSCKNVHYLEEVCVLFLQQGAQTLNTRLSKAAHTQWPEINVPLDRTEELPVGSKREKNTENSIQVGWWWAKKISLKDLSQHCVVFFLCPLMPFLYFALKWVSNFLLLEPYRFIYYEKTSFSLPFFPLNCLQSLTARLRMSWFVMDFCFKLCK